MVLTYKNIDIYYKVLGEGKTLIVLMHGWGSDGKLMLPLYKYLYSSEFKFLIVDFPPFGKSKEPFEPWTLNNYVEIVEILIQKQKDINKTYLIGHSFGGRVAIKISARKNLQVNKLILLSSAGISPRYSIKTKYKIFKYKILKNFKKNNNLGSKDYRILSPIMKKTFINIVNEDLTKICNQIKCKTLIVFGDKDKETPLYMGKILHKKIKDSELIVVKNGGHFVYIYNIDFLLPIIKTFLTVN